MIELSVIRDLVAIFGVIAGFSYYVLTVRATRKNQEQQLETRHTQLFLQYTRRIDKIRDNWDEVFNNWSWKDYNDFMEKYGPDTNPEKWKVLMSVTAIFEEMGVLATHGSIDIQLVYDMMASYPIRLWDKIEPIIDEYRIEEEHPPKGQFMEYFEELTYMLRDIRAKDIEDFKNRLNRRKQRREQLGRPMPDYNR